MRGRHTPSEGSTTCSQCLPGKFSDELGDLVCKPCNPGYTSALASAACVACVPGRYSGEAAPECLSCPPGSFGSHSGETGCKECQTGQFSTFENQTACASCYETLNPGGPNPDLWVTMEQVEWKGQLEWANMLGALSVASCGCGDGAWLSLASECFECGEGMICRGMGVVELKSGYFSTFDDAGSVWRCYGDDSGCCPGGLPGSCARHRQNTSIACGECEPRTKKTTVGPCEACTGNDTGLLVAAVVVLLGGLSCVYFAIATENRAKQKDSVALIAIMCSQLLTVFQMLGLFNLLSVQWPEPFATMVKLGTVLNFRLEFLNVGCVGPMSALAWYMFTAFASVFLVIFMVVLHSLRWMAFRFSRIRHWFVHWRPSLVGAVGTIFVAVFILVSSTILAPLRCDVHPNGQQTVQSYQVVCWNSDYGTEHRNMIVVAAFATLVPVGFIALCMWVVVSLPSRMRQGDTVFLHTFAFLLFRFRPGAQCYVLVVMLRNFAVALVPIISDVSLELFVLAVVLVLCVLTSVAVLPWAVYQANFIDTGTNMGFLLITFLAALATNVAEEDLLAILLVVIFAGILSLLLIGVAYSLFMLCSHRKNTYQFFLCHHKEGSGSFARLLKMCLQTHPQVTRKVFLDSDNLVDLRVLFEVVGSRTDTLVVLCSSDILSRPWCVGEMVTARLHDIDTFLVRLPDFKWPSLEFLDNYAVHVEGIFSLTEFGIDEEMAKATFLWLRSRPSVLLPLSVTLSCVEVIARKLVVRKCGKREDVRVPGMSVCRSAGVFDSALEAEPPTGELSVSLARDGDGLQEGPLFQVAEGLSDSTPTAACLFVSIVDQTNQEAVFTALIIKELLKPKFPLISEVLCVLLSDDDLPENTNTLLVMCSNGCFRSRSFVRQLLQAQELNASMVPIIVDKDFRFPTEAFYSELDAMSAHLLSGTEYHGRQLTRRIRTLFKEIGIRVDPQDSERVLHVRAVAIANRISGAGVRSAGVRREVSHNDEEQPHSDSEDILKLIHVEGDIPDDTEHFNVEVELFSTTSEHDEPVLQPERSWNSGSHGDFVSADPRVVGQPWQTREMRAADEVSLCCHADRRTWRN